MNVSNQRAGMRRIKSIGTFFYWFIVGLLLAVALLVVLSKFSIVENTRLLVVLSGSMEPAIPTGSLVVVSAQDSYGVGDVITYDATSIARLTRPTPPITHRIVSIREENGERIYETKGDNNTSADSYRVTDGAIFGKVTAHVPYIGYPVGFAKTPKGFMLLIGLPALVIIIGELRIIKEELKKIVNSKVQAPKEEKGEQSV